jgi:5-keto 4-deoxyuronate isomerase
MLVRFTLTMDDLTVDGEHFDSVILDWESDTSQEEVMRMSEKWISTQDFLTRRMLGLTRVGESSLTIEPVDENPKYEPELGDFTDGRAYIDGN